MLCVHPYRRVVFALGSNLGDRESHLHAAVDALSREEGIQNLVLSPIYETTPVGGPQQDDYLNAAVAVQTHLEPTKLLELAMRIEREQARVRLERNGPRTLDIDILWIEGEKLDEPALTVPHPRLHERAFALRPMLDLMPDLIDPRNGERFSSYLQRVDQAGVQRYEGTKVDTAGDASAH